MTAKRMFSGMIILASMLTAHASLAQNQAPGDERAEAGDNLYHHLDKLSRLNPRSCPADYRKFSKEKDLRIGLFFGYANFEKQVLDVDNALAFVDVLTEPCQGTIKACGFRQIAKAPQAYLLRKSLPKGRSVEIEIRYSGLTSDNERNTGELSLKQEEHSHKIRDRFNKAIGDSDVVLYMGHARYGGGMGFFAANLVTDALNIVFRNPLRGTTEALGFSKRIKAFGVLGCETDGHYRRNLEEANASVDLVLAKTIMEANSVHQTGLAVVDSILAERCQPELTKALTTDLDAKDEHEQPIGVKEALEYLRRP